MKTIRMLLTTKRVTHIILDMNLYTWRGGRTEKWGGRGRERDG